MTVSLFQLSLQSPYMWYRRLTAGLVRMPGVVCITCMGRSKRCAGFVRAVGRCL